MGLDQNRNSGSAWLDCQAIEAWIDGHRVVKDLSLRLLKGESTAVLGPNGAGKTTLVKLISRTLYPVVKPGSYWRLFGSETVNLWALRQRLGVVSTELEQRIPAFAHRAGAVAGSVLRRHQAWQGPNAFGATAITLRRRSPFHGS